MKIKLTKRDILWSYIGSVMSIGANVMLLPFIVHFLEDDMLGLWYVFSSLGAIAALFDCGFSVTFARNITYCWGGAKKLCKENVEESKNVEPDFLLMKKILTTCKIIYFIISFSALILLSIFGTLYIYCLTGANYGTVPVISWCIYVVGVFLNLYFGYYSSFLRGVGAVDEANINTIISKTVQIILTIFFLVCGFDLIGICISYLVSGTVLRILGKTKFYKYKGIGDALSKITNKYSCVELKDLFMIIWHNAWRDGAISICNFFCNQVTTIICAMYLSLAETGIYSLGVQVTQAVATVAATLYTTYQPTLQEAYLNSDLPRIKKSMSVVVMSFVYLFLLGGLALITVGMPLLRILKPTIDITYGIVLGLLAYQFMLKLRNCYTSYFSCTNRICYLNAFIVSAFLCTTLSFIMIGPLHLGISGLIIAQICSQIYNFLIWSMRAHKEIGLGIRDMIYLGSAELLRRGL